MEISRKLTISEIVLSTVLAVVIGVLFWGWTFVYDLLSPFLKPLGLNYLLVGFWYIAGLLPPFIIRKPGVALMSEVLAAVVEGFIAQWGLTAVFWGLAQGIAAELIFLIFAYRKWGLKVMLLAGAFSGLGNYVLDYFYYDYGSIATKVIALQIGCIIISGAILGGLVTYNLGIMLKKSGVVNQYRIVQDDLQ